MPGETLQVCAVESVYAKQCMQTYHLVKGTDLRHTLIRIPVSQTTKNSFPAAAAHGGDTVAV